MMDLGDRCQGWGGGEYLRFTFSHALLAFGLAIFFLALLLGGSFDMHNF